MKLCFEWIAISKRLCGASLLVVLFVAGPAVAASLANGQTLSFAAAGAGDLMTQPTLGTGSWFSLSSNSPQVGGTYYIPIQSYNGIVLGTTQAASGSHSGDINGTELPDIDSPWVYWGNTGMHLSTSPVSVIDATHLDFSGWGVTWNGSITPLGVGDFSTGGIASYAYNSGSNAYTLDYTQSRFDAGATVTYTLHLEGVASSVVPIPPAAWLFGSGLLGLLGVARKKCNSSETAVKAWRRTGFSIDGTLRGS